MIEVKTHFDIEPVNPLPSDEIIADPTVAWHAIRGYDFAGLEAILQTGLLPAENQQDFGVSVSASPEQAWSSGRVANSFCMYTLQDGISLAIKQNNPVCPVENYGGFVDEVRFASVSPEAITGVMLPEEAVNRPLVDIATRHETRKPMQTQSYIERTVAHIEALGGQIDEDTRIVIYDCLATSVKGEFLSREQSGRLEALFMKAYSDAIEKARSISNPTVKDVLETIFAKVRKSQVFTYTDAQKQEVYSHNAQLTFRNQTRGIGSTAVRLNGRLLSLDGQNFFDVAIAKRGFVNTNIRNEQGK